MERVMTSCVSSMRLSAVPAPSCRPGSFWFTTQRPRLSQRTWVHPLGQPRPSHITRSQIPDEIKMEEDIENILHRGEEGEKTKEDGDVQGALEPGDDPTVEEEEEFINVVGEIAEEIDEDDSTAVTPLEAASNAAEKAYSFTLNVLWMSKVIGIAVDQMFGELRSPLTAYAFWPQEEAWEKTKHTLEYDHEWIAEEERIRILNEFTALINYWESEGASLEGAKERFPLCTFHG